MALLQEFKLCRGKKVFVLVLVVFMQVNEATRICFSCTNLAENEKCDHVTYCRDNEVCFVQKYQGVGNVTHYDVGSLPKGFIWINNRKRSDHSHVICQSCCDDNVCNAKLTCENNQQGQKCVSCSEVNDPATCNTSVWCKENEVCFVHEYTTEMNKTQYDLGCKASNLCLHSLSNLFGRRTSAGRHLMCESCCSRTALCNMDLKCGKHNAMCTNNNQCEKDLQCVQHTCQCDPTDFWNGSSCTLRKSLNTTCTTTNECKDSMFCIHGKCRCAFDVDFWDGNACVLRQPRECSDIGNDTDGKYAIYPWEGNDTRVFVYCIMEQNKKWTVIQRRYNGSVSFARYWNDYKHGFGNVEGEYWLGNDLIHALTQNGNYELSIHLVDSNGRHGYANYSTFSIGNETSRYVLTIGGYSGNIGDSMDKLYQPTGSLNGTKFATYDRKDVNHCAIFAERGGWWYNRCFFAHLNRQYAKINWDYWPRNNKIVETVMMIKKFRSFI